MRIYLNAPTTSSCLNNNDSLIALVEEVEKEAKNFGQAIFPLHVAADHGYKEVVEFLLNRGDDIEGQEEDGCTALHTATILGRREIVELLLKNGANKDARCKKGFSPLHYAAALGEIGILALLLEAGADIEAKDNTGMSPLHTAVMNRKKEIMNFLLLKRAKPDAVCNGGRTPLHYAAGFGEIEILALLLEARADIEAKDYEGMTLLHTAVKFQKKEIMHFLLLKKAKVDSVCNEGRTPLHYAVITRNQEMAADLVKEGADLEAQTMNGMTPLHLATIFGHPDLTLFLLNLGANKEAESKERETPLHHAVIKGHYGVAEILLGKGANLEATNILGARPLHLAIYYEQVEVTALLLQKGAITDAVTQNLKTPLHLLKHGSSSFIPLLKLLLEYGADPCGALHRDPEYFKAIAEIKKVSPPSPEEITQALEEMKVRKLLGHRFGIAMSKMDLGLGFELPIKTEGFYNDNIVTLELKESIVHFLNRNPHFYSQKIQENLDLLFDRNPITSEKAALMIESFRRGELVVIHGNWKTHYACLVLFKNALFSCNRGDYVEEGVAPGIQLYQFKDPSLFTREKLLQIHNSPRSLLHGDARKKLGLKKTRIASMPRNSQPGGFCSWDNLKLGFELLLTLSKTLPDDFEFNRKINETEFPAIYREAREVYKAWSAFDREHAIEKAIKRYENDSKYVDIPLMLHILAHHKGSLESLERLLGSLPVTNEHFLSLDKRGRSIFHQIKTQANIDALKRIAGERWESLRQALINQADASGITPFRMALIRRHWSAAKVLFSNGANLNESFKMPAWHMAVSSNDPELIQFFIEEGADLALLSDQGWTIVHAALFTEANRVVAYFLEEWDSIFFVTEEDKNHYLQFALQGRNWEGALLLIKNGASLEFLTPKVRKKLLKASQNGDEHAKRLQQL